MALPFAVLTDVVAIDGGWLKHPMVLKPIYFGGVPCMPVHRENRPLARCMGLNMTLRHPWGGRPCKVLDFIVKARDDTVDSLIQAKYMDDDPMADAVEYPDKKGPKQRSKAFAECEIPELVQVTMPAFISTEDGKHVPSFVATVVSTPKKGSQPHMQLDAAHLDWLRHAVHGLVVDDVVPHKDEADVGGMHMPHIDQPNVRWQKRKGRPAAMGCRYWSAGQWKLHTKMPRLTGNDEYDTEVVRSTAAEVQKFYDENHEANSSNA